MKESFSQRMGFKQVRDSYQINDIDDKLRNRLWNSLKQYYWDEFEKKLYERPSSGGLSYLLSKDKSIKRFYEKLWDKYFKKSLDDLNIEWKVNHNFVRDYFFSCSWYEVYDFIEFVVNSYDVIYINDKYKSRCNSILESEMSAYRFVDNIISPIIENEEINEIEKAIETLSYEPVKKHLKSALEKLSDRETPDYRNSIKESISAVEALCKIISGKEKSTLGEALKIIESEKGILIHSSLNEAFKKLYGYTSDEGGIRHAMIDDNKKVKQEDARFMLIACSAFVNYLIDKMKD